VAASEGLSDSGSAGSATCAENDDLTHGDTSSSRAGV
jgi:hypothetical protein